MMKNDDRDPLIGVKVKTGIYPAAASPSGRRRRIRGLGIHEADYFHVMSRTCGGAVFFDEVEKDALRRVLRRMAAFSGVEVLTYCVMGNHFHVLVRVPHRPTWLARFDGPNGENLLMKHLRVLYSKGYVAQLEADIAEWRRLGSENRVKTKLEAFKRRMCDLSRFVKEVKERFTRWYNKRHERKGTLWMDRFKSVLVEGRPSKAGGWSSVNALKVMAAYIDLNPVRAGLVSDPGEYRWSGYGEAVSGGKEARRGLNRVMGRSPEAGWESAGGAEAYRCFLFDEGREVKPRCSLVGTSDQLQHEGKRRKGISSEQVRQVLEAGGKLSATEMVRLRVRYFSDGTAIGSRAFVEEVFGENKTSFGSKRQKGANKIRECGEALYSLRRLQRRTLE